MARVKPEGVLDLSQVSACPLGLVGGKAKGLGRLIAYGAPVPPGFVVSPGVDLKLTGDAILNRFDRLQVSHVAVRSSAAGEDSLNQSWAGQFATFLYVSRHNLLDRITECRLSGTSHRAKAYGDTGGDMPVAVVVQTMVPSQVAGVCFTVDPVIGDDSQLMIEAVYGLGEQLVQGLATPDNYVLSKSSLSVVSQNIALKPDMLVGDDTGVHLRPVAPSKRSLPALSPDRLRALGRCATLLEQKFNCPLDIEWGYDHKQLYIVQARPITTLTKGES